MARHKEEHPDSPLGVYVGLNAGEPIAEDDDLFGTSINLAARICDHAEAGQIVAADVVRHPLVTRMVRAYEAHEKQNGDSRNEPSGASS